jgi:hypothetical protein
MAMRQGELLTASDSAADSGRDRRALTNRAQLVLEALP